MGRALAPAEDREASWQSSPGRIPGQRGADGRAFRALAGGIPGPLAEGTDLALLFLLLGHFLSVLLPLVGFLRRLDYFICFFFFHFQLQVLFQERDTHDS